MYRSITKSSHAALIGVDEMRAELFILWTLLHSFRPSVSLLNWQQEVLVSGI